MTATIDQLMDQHSGRGESQESGVSTDLELWNALHAELQDLRTKYAALLAKLDTDFTAQNAAVTGSQLDTDYAATQGLAPAQLLKGS